VTLIPIAIPHMPHAKKVYKYLKWIDSTKIYSNFGPKVANYIEIETNISKSCDVEGKVNTRSQERVISICEKTDAKVYINPIGGLELYSREDFSSCGVSLQFLKAKQTPYRQIFGGFEPSLSIIDLLMNLSKEQIKTILSEDFEIK